ncbi:hypothetical protein HK405_002374 [Cladochytrium tenue]|nr:hypothetical protein HK405_002374 [Cladochytrium tenue]
MSPAQEHEQPQRQLPPQPALVTVVGVASQTSFAFPIAAATAAATTWSAAGSRIPDISPPRRAHAAESPSRARRPLIDRDGDDGLATTVSPRRSPLGDVSNIRQANLLPQLELDGPAPAGAPALSVHHQPPPTPEDPQRRRRARGAEPSVVMWECGSCHSSVADKQVEYRYNITFLVTRGGLTERVSAFGESLNPLFGLTATELRRRLLRKLPDVPPAVQAKMVLASLEQVSAGLILSRSSSSKVGRVAADLDDITGRLKGVKLSTDEMAPARRPLYRPRTCVSVPFPPGATVASLLGLIEDDCHEVVPYEPASPNKLDDSFTSTNGSDCSELDTKSSDSSTEIIMIPAFEAEDFIGLPSQTTPATGRQLPCLSQSIDSDHANSVFQDISVATFFGLPSPPPSTEPSKMHVFGLSTSQSPSIASPSILAPDSPEYEKTPTMSTKSSVGSSVIKDSCGVRSTRNKPTTTHFDTYPSSPSLRTRARRVVLQRRAVEELVPAMGRLGIGSQGVILAADTPASKIFVPDTPQSEDPRSATERSRYKNDYYVSDSPLSPEPTGRNIGAGTKRSFKGRHVRGFTGRLRDDSTEAYKADLLARQPGEACSSCSNVSDSDPSSSDDGMHKLSRPATRSGSSGGASARKWARREPLESSDESDACCPLPAQRPRCPTDGANRRTPSLCKRPGRPRHSDTLASWRGTPSSLSTGSFGDKTSLSPGQWTNSYRTQRLSPEAAANRNLPPPPQPKSVAELADGQFFLSQHAYRTLVGGNRARAHSQIHSTNPALTGVASMSFVAFGGITDILKDLDLERA